MSATKPVKLQVNTSGAWKNLVAFDAADGPKCAQALEAAEMLGNLHGGSVAFRVATDDASSLALMHWSKGEGWREARNVLG